MPATKTRRRAKARNPVARPANRAIPETMRAAAINTFGDPSVFSIMTLPVLSISANEVLIAVDAAGVGTWDAKIRDGEWAEGDDVEFPLVLGTDGSGTVAAIGSRVTRLAVGDDWHFRTASSPSRGNDAGCESNRTTPNQGCVSSSA